MKARRAALSVLVLLILVGLPPAAARPASISVLRNEHAEAVDFESGLVWFLLIGSDARPGLSVFEGNADALQLVGIDFDTGRAVALGVPRDFWVDAGDGLIRINETLAEQVEGVPLEGPDLVAATVAEVVGITPHYVITVGLEGFSDLVDAIGGVTVFSPLPFNDEEHPLRVRKGLNRFDGSEATTFARVRKALDHVGGDFARSANHQRLLKAIVRQVQGREDEMGFMESRTLEALSTLDTNLSPVELYRLGQAIAQLELRRVTTCVLPGTRHITSEGADVIRPLYRQISRISRDVSRDARIDGSC